MYVYTLDTWVCTIGDDIAIYSSDGRLPEQQSFCVGDVDRSQTAGLIQSCNTQTHAQNHCELTELK